MRRVSAIEASGATTLTNGDHLDVALLEATLDLVEIAGVEVIPVVSIICDKGIGSSGVSAGGLPEMSMAVLGLFE